MNPTTSELFIEIRCEELPARFANPAVEGLERGVRALLKGLSHGGVRTWVTPRRLAIAVSELADARAVEEKLVTGPSASVAFKDGEPTSAALGFARRYGLGADALEIVEGPKGTVIAVRQQMGGERTLDVVAAGLEALVLGIPFTRAMRWGSGKARWGRPFHGVVAVFGGQRVPATIAGMDTTTTTIGHRLYPDPIEVADSASWLAGMVAHKVEPDPAVRRARILAELGTHAAALGASVPDLPDLLDEVVNLVEWPVVITGALHQELMHLPPRLLVESMKVHQRYFPVFVGDSLDHHFLVVTNQPTAGDPEVAALIGAGNASVLSARFHDARHFYAEDRKHRLETRWKNLEGMGWIRKGGTMADKSNRLVALTGRIAPLLDAPADVAARAALLCKCDLATLMVGEFPELQGHVGRLLAAHQGEDERVGTAIEEHYLPRFYNDNLPITPAGRVLALSDRLDSLAGCFALDQRPKGSADPLGLRRAANGVVQILLAADAPISLDPLFAAALQTWEDLGANARLGPDAVGLRADLVAFTLTRLRASLAEVAAPEFVDAVLASGDCAPVALMRRLEPLVALSRTPGFDALKSTFKRVIGLTREHTDPSYSVPAFTEAAELGLHTALIRASDHAEAAIAGLDFAGALDALAGLKGPVDRLFDTVLVMADDAAVRDNRLGLLRAVANAFHEVADLTHLTAEA